MRDIVIARRALLALAAGIAVAGWPGHPVAARPSGKARLPPRPVRKPVRVVALDPGHGGVDPRAISPGRVFQKKLHPPRPPRLAPPFAGSRPRFSLLSP